MGGRSGEKARVLFQKPRGTWNLGLSFTVAGAFPAVPVVYGKHLSGVAAQLQRLLLVQEPAPHVTPLSPPLPSFGPVIELFSSRLGGEHEGP